MTNEVISNRIGYRYLFDSKGCSLSNRDEVTINLIVSEKYNLQIYFGSKPKHGIQSVSGCSKYYVPGTATPLGTFEFKKDVDKSSKYGPFFLEIVVSTEANALVTNNDTSQNLLLNQAENRRDEFRNVINLVAGIIGLRFHRQFVLELINENALAWKDEVPIQGYAGPLLEILEPLRLNDLNQLEAMRNVFASLSNETVRKIGLIFHWLLCAWHERDNNFNFIALFIPLECILSNSNDSQINDDDERRAKAIRKLIKKFGGDESEELRCFIDRLTQRLSPTLDERFIDLAKTAKLPGWEADIEAFRRFKRMRNALFHGGSKDVQQTVSVGDEDVRTFSDIVERYINFVLFNDNKVYRSRWRPKIGENSNHMKK
jgi:hypothetical protein